MICVYEAHITRNHDLLHEDEIQGESEARSELYKSTAHEHCNFQRRSSPQVFYGRLAAPVGR